MLICLMPSMELDPINIPVKKYWDVECKYDNLLKMLYITGKKTTSSQTSTFIPMACSDDVSFTKMQTLFKIGDSPSDHNW